MSGTAGARLPRALTLWPLVGIAYFTVSGGAYGIEDLVPSLGPTLSLVLLLVMPLLWSLPIALVAAELATAMPEEGGYYVWVRRSLGDFWGFQAGWWNVFTSLADSAIYPVLFAGYLQTFFPGMGAWGRFMAAAALIWVVAALNVAGIRPVGVSTVVLGIGIQLPVLALTIGGFLQAKGWPWQVTQGTGGWVGAPAAAGLGVGVSVLLWNYSGWDNTSTYAGEVAEPGTNYPRAIVIAMPFVALGYLLPVGAALAAGVDPGAWKTGGLPAIGASVGGPWLGYALAWGGMASMAGIFAALLLSYSRLFFVMARDGYLPRPLAKVHPAWGTPWVSIAASAGACTALAPLPFKQLVVFDVILYCLTLGLQCAALVRRRRRGAAPGAFQIPGGAVGVGLAVGCLGLAAALVIGSAGPGALLWGGAAALTGPVAYGMIRRLRVRRAAMAAS